MYLQLSILRVFASEKSSYDSGYDHGCDDAGRSESDKYINQPEKGASFHTNEFMDGYYAGLNACANGRTNSEGNDDDGNCKFGPGNCGPGSCYARGVEDGKNNDFGDFFKVDSSGDCDAGEFFPRYYQGFIDYQFLYRGYLRAGKEK
ncbi:MAG TPA: hypothetical protein VE130_07545 [Nitrososphaeraceae archaeon]|jgi:hypothetical protein|nr:hypothetical protein [Nitrososphaeraceae archaeon]